MNFIVEAMLSLVPNANLSWIGEEWEGLTWYDSRPCPTREEWEAEKSRLISIQPLQDCKTKAKQLLINSDWSELPSVIEQLENANEWKSYRMEIRKYIINPIENPTFPSEPKTIWKEI